MATVEESVAARIVPSGKVYRQMFDAEVQLVKALEKRELTMVMKSADKDGATLRSATIPVVHQSWAVMGSGILDERQKTWVASFPNEPYVENPVVYKFLSEEQKAYDAEKKTPLESKEVRGLPDVLTPSKVGSDIIERIGKSRKQRHECALEDLHQDLGLTNHELEPRIQKVGQELLEKLHANDLEIEQIMDRITRNEDLQQYTLDGLHKLWEEVSGHSNTRRTLIAEVDKELAQMETERMEKVRKIFQCYAKILERIAHLMPPDLQRLLDKESQFINQTVLSNRRAYADLYQRLMMADIDREKRLHIQWEAHVEDWSGLHIETAIIKFSAEMQSEDMVRPVNALKVLEEMKIEQANINYRRLELIDSLKDLKPPSATKTAVYNWNQQVMDISKDIDGLNQSFFTKLYKEYEKVCQDCLAEVDKIMTFFTNSGVCSEAQSKQIVQDKCLPLVGQLQRSYEQSLELMDKALESHNAYLLGELKSLFKYCQGTAHLWDVHEIGLARQERLLQEKLESCRQAHDNTNQEKEVQLDIIMDRMRQDATEQALKESLATGLEMLKRIKDSYGDFHTQLVNIVVSYPEMVNDEVTSFDNAVCKFFSVDRRHPDEREALAKKKKTTKSLEHARAEQTRAGSPLLTAVSEVLSTAKGTTFYVLTIAGEHGVPAEDSKPDDNGEDNTSENSAAFITESASESEIVAKADLDEKPDYLVNVDIPNEVILNIKKAIRLNFLNYLEEWHELSSDRTQIVVSAKTAELDSELELRLHLHEPRSRRAELDVHNVRAAELVMHSERVTRHCKGITQAIGDLKTRFNDMVEEHNQKVDQYRLDIEALEVVFINATKSAKLVSLSNQLQLECDKYMTIIRTSLRKFRQYLDDTLQMVRQSNARFIKSFKVFSDGGNFCPEEIEEFRKKLESMATKIDTAEGLIMTDLDGMESKRLEQATKISGEFDDSFKNHMVDLVFMEKVSRWLTNTQVKIKAEVAFSNTQGQKLSQSLDDLDRRIDACLRPNPDKQIVSSQQLKDGLDNLFEAFYDRARYLNSLKDLNLPPPQTPLQGNLTQAGMRVAFTTDLAAKAGKTPSDESIGVIKNILRTQKCLVKELEPADTDEAPTSATAQATPAQQAATQGPEARRAARGSRQVTETDLRSKKMSRQGTAISGVVEKRIPSAKGVKFDPKYMVFGAKEDLGEDTHLLGKIRRLLRDALDGLLSVAEVFYRTKGPRPVTRPQALQETFELCADVCVAKLQSYFSQADEFHNHCLQELRQHLQRVELTVIAVPAAVIDDLLTRGKHNEDMERGSLRAEFSQQLRLSDKEKAHHQSQLRPTLGHPQMEQELIQLCLREDKRREKHLVAVGEHTEELKEIALKHSQAFVVRLARTAEQLLLDVDGLLTIDDVEKGRVVKTKRTTSELLRRQKAGQQLEEDEVQEIVDRTKKTWPGLPKNKMQLETVIIETEVTSDRVVSAPKEQPKFTASITTAKHTLGHSGTVEQRDRAYKKYQDHFDRTIAAINLEHDRLINVENRWTESWKIAVNKIKKLY